VEPRKLLEFLDKLMLEAEQLRQEAHRECMDELTAIGQDMVADLDDDTDWWKCACGRWEPCRHCPPEEEDS
jgi:hypothetical protein